MSSHTGIGIFLAVIFLGALIQNLVSTKKLWSVSVLALFAVLTVEYFTLPVSSFIRYATVAVLIIAGMVSIYSARDARVLRTWRIW